VNNCPSCYRRMFLEEETSVSLQALEGQSSSVILLHMMNCLAKFSSMNIRTDLAFNRQKNPKPNVSRQN